MRVGLPADRDAGRVRDRSSVGAAGARREPRAAGVHGLTSWETGRKFGRGVGESLKPSVIGADAHGPGVIWREKKRRPWGYTRGLLARLLPPARARAWLVAVARPLLSFHRLSRARAVSFALPCARAGTARRGVASRARAHGGPARARFFSSLHRFLPRAELVVPGETSRRGSFPFSTNRSKNEFTDGIMVEASSCGFIRFWRATSPPVSLSPLHLLLIPDGSSND